MHDTCSHELFDLKNSKGFKNNVYCGGWKILYLTVVTSFIEFSCISLMFSTKKGDTPNVESWRREQIFQSEIYHLPRLGYRVMVQLLIYKTISNLGNSSPLKTFILSQGFICLQFKYWTISTPVLQVLCTNGVRDKNQSGFSSLMFIILSSFLFTEFLKCNTFDVLVGWWWL